jgi:hypothetical protein
MASAFQQMTIKKTLSSLTQKVFFDKNKLAWISLDDYKYPRMALWLPEFYSKEALCETHYQIFAGHNAAQKFYLKLTSSYFWPNVSPPLAPLLITDQPNLQIHADLFCPMLGSNRKSAFILCITDTFTKYAVVTKVDNKDAETLQNQFLKTDFANRIRAQIHTNRGKEFVNKLSVERFELLNMQHSKTSPYHPQCNAQVEVYTKTVRKYLAFYVKIQLSTGTNGCLLSC